MGLLEGREMVIGEKEEKIGRKIREDYDSQARMVKKSLSRGDP